MSVKEWIELVQNLGVACICLLFMDELSTAIAAQSQALQTMAVQQGRNLEGLEKIMKRTDDLLDYVVQLRGQVK